MIINFINAIVAFDSNNVCRKEVRILPKIALPSRIKAPNEKVDKCED